MHNVNSQHKDIAAPLFQRLQNSQHDISNSGPTVWNSFPLNLGSIDTLNRFKRELKNYFIDKYVQKKNIAIYVYLWLITV